MFHLCDRGHNGGITGIQINNSDFAVTSSYDATVRLWDVRTSGPLAVIDVNDASQINE